VGTPISFHIGSDECCIIHKKIKMEKSKELELLKQENSELKKENNLLTIKSRINDLINENYSNSVNMGLWVEITFKETNDYGLVFNIESSSDLVNLENDEIEIGYDEINEWFEKEGKEFNQINLIECLNELTDNNI
jgi:hypothetical protein